MLIQNTKVLLSIFPFITMISCTSTPRETAKEARPNYSYSDEAESRNVSNAVAIEAKAHDFVDIQFDHAHSTLSRSAKESLEAVVEQSLRAGNIDEVIVLSWADEEFPSKMEKNLSDSQRELATTRNEVIEKFLKRNRSVKVNTYNMAERSNAFSKLFRTNDSRLKASLIAAGLPTTADKNQFPSKASHSIILVKIE